MIEESRIYLNTIAKIVVVWNYSLVVKRNYYEENHHRVRVNRHLMMSFYRIKDLDVFKRRRKCLKKKKKPNTNKGRR